MDEIKSHGQVIVYMVHENVGHLGIFVSGGWPERNTRHHRKCRNARLPVAGAIRNGCQGQSQPTLAGHYDVHFKPRTMDDILELDDGLKDEEAFFPANTISRINDDMYRIFLSPWVRATISEATAEIIRQMHPLSNRTIYILGFKPLHAAGQTLG